MYHMYFQSTDPGQSPGSVWGHAVSPDLVRWTRQNRTQIKGSSGGGISLPPQSATRQSLTTAKWNAAAFASVPTYLHPPRIVGPRWFLRPKLTSELLQAKPTPGGRAVRVALGRLKPDQLERLHQRHVPWDDRSSRWRPDGTHLPGPGP